MASCRIELEEAHYRNIQPNTLSHRLGDDHAAAGGAHLWRILQRANFTGARTLLSLGGLLAFYQSDCEANAANRLLDSAGEWLPGQASVA
jgi:hypothetical protein